MKLRPALAFAAAGSLGALAGCIVTNSQHCALEGTVCGDGMVCSKCAIDNNGCVAAGSIDDDQCLYLGPTTDPASTGTDPTTSTGTTTVEPPDTTTTTTLDLTTDDTTASTTIPVDPSTSTTTGTTGTSETTEQGPCDAQVVVDNPMCGGDTPYCIDGACVGCDMLPSCAAVEPTKPACEETSGRCVECLTSDDCTSKEEPVCNTDLATCGPCTAHDQCPATACNLDLGECFPPEHVLYVNNTIDICSDAKVGYGTSAAMPYCTLQTAMKKVQIGTPTTIKIKPGSKQQSLPSSLQPGDYVVAIVPDQNQVPSLVVTTDFPALSLYTDNKVYMYRVGIYNNTPLSDPAIDCSGATLWLDRQRIYNTVTALHADNCKVHVRRSVIFGHKSGGLDMTGSDPQKAMLWVENSFLTGNEGDKFGAVRLDGAASAKILYTTIALNPSPVAPIECTNWTGNLEVRNAAIVDLEPHFGAGCMKKQKVVTTFELAEDDQLQLNNVFSGFAEGVYQAREGGALADQAKWLQGDPTLDYDGTKRPTEDGSLDYAGADNPG